MPAHITHLVVSTKIQRLDTFVHRGETVTVHQVDVKQKYTHLTIDGGTIVRIPIDVQVEITRLEKTEEEVATERHAYRLRMIEDEIADAVAAVETAREKLLEHLDKDPAWHIHHWVVYSEAQLHNGIWQHVAATARNRDVDLLEAVQLIREQYTRDLINRDLRFTSRSSGTVNNVAEDLANEVKVSWLRDMRWKFA